MTSLLIKNQANIKQEANYSSLAKFVVYILNLGYEHSTFQQLTDLVAVDEEIMKLYCDELFKKIFKGRNVNIKAKDTKFIIRFLMSRYISPCDIVKRLLLYLKPKDNGGARTPHQVSLILSLIGYVAELIISKVDQMQFKEKEIGRVIVSFKEIIEQNINEGKIDNDDENDNEDIQIKNKKKQGFLTELENMYFKLNTAFSKCNNNVESQSINTKKEEVSQLFKNAINKSNIPKSQKEKKKALKAKAKEEE